MNALVCLSTVLFAPQDPLVAEVATGHRANFGRVRTMRAVFDVRSGLEGDAKVFERTALVYHRDPNGVLVRDGVEGRMLAEYSLLDGETRGYTRVWPVKEKAPQVRASRLRRDQTPVNFNLWLTMGGEVTDNSFHPRALDVALSESEPPAQGSRDIRDGVPLIKIVRFSKSAQGASSRIQEWYDPARGYVAVRSEATGDWVATTERSGLKMSADGVWFPTRQEYRGKNTTDNVFAETTVAELAINQPLPAGATALPLPAGTLVKDGLRNTEYTGNPDWTPAGPEKPWQRLIVTPPADPGGFTGQTQAEPVGWSRWLLYAAAAVLAVGLIGLGVRKMLARRAEGAA